MGAIVKAQPPRFYHGTRRGFTVNGWLVPRTFHGNAEVTTAPTNPGRERTEDSDAWVYVTTDVNLAWAYAWCAPGRGCPKVVEVHPSALEHDPEHRFDVPAYRCKSARVVRVHRDSPMTEDEARMGWVLDDDGIFPFSSRRVN